MLMRLCEVSKEGKFSRTGDPRVLYSVMMYIRMLIIRDCGNYSMAGSLIGLRYLAVRRQFKTYKDTKEERTILDYQTTQHIFGGLLARSAAMQICGGWVMDEFKKMMDDIQLKNYQRMDGMHHVLAGFKALMTDSMIANVETARRACGGAGYASNSGFTELYQNVSPMPTYEGENTVMLL